MLSFFPRSFGAARIAAARPFACSMETPPLALGSSVRGLVHGRPAAALAGPKPPGFPSRDFGRSDPQTTLLRSAAAPWLRRSGSLPGDPGAAAAVQTTEVKSWIRQAVGAPDQRKPGFELAFLDVRETKVFDKQGHPLFAANIPVAKLEAEIPRLVPRKTTLVVLMDEGGDDVRANYAKARLEAAGYSNVRTLEGGMRGWRDQGLEVFTSVNVPSKAFGEHIYDVVKPPELSVEEVQKKQEQGAKMVILDSRSYDEYHKMSIPDGVFCGGAELVHKVFEVAPDPDTLVVVNCAGRTRSIVGVQSLVNAGLKNVAACRNGTMGWHLAGLKTAKKATEVAPPPGTAALTKAQQAAAQVATKFQVKSCTWAEAQAWLAETEAGGRTTYLFDVRLPEEYAEKHVVGSQSAPGGQLVYATDEYVGVLGGRVVLIDGGEAVRAPMTASWLLQTGVVEAYVLEGGIQNPCVELGAEPFVPASLPPLEKDVVLPTLPESAAKPKGGGAKPTLDLIEKAMRDYLENAYELSAKVIKDGDAGWPALKYT